MHKAADLKQRNGKCISFLRWNLNDEVTTLKINELYTFFMSNTFLKLASVLLNFFMNRALNVA